jgi:hypothetical protein
MRKEQQMDPHERQKEALIKAHHAAQHLLGDLRDIHPTSVALELLVDEFIEQVKKVSQALDRLAREP